MFQFPLHRDPRCNNWQCYFDIPLARVSVPFTSGSSLQLPTMIDGLMTLEFQFPLHRDPRCNASFHGPRYAHRRFSSLYIGILAATIQPPLLIHLFHVSVPFTSGSSLQPVNLNVSAWILEFQFPLHRDPRCNKYAWFEEVDQFAFQFPLHRDPRCNSSQPLAFNHVAGYVSVPFTSGSSLQRGGSPPWQKWLWFQFPLHRDPRCNLGQSESSVYGRTFQFPLHRDPRCNYKKLPVIFPDISSFSSLYIGILAATFRL